MAEPKWLKDMNPDEYMKEDFKAEGKSEAGTTIEGIDKNDQIGSKKQLKKFMQLKVAIM